MSADNQIGGAAGYQLDLFGSERSFFSARSEIGQQAGGLKGSCHMLNTRRQKSLESARDARRYGTGSASWERRHPCLRSQDALPVPYQRSTLSVFLAASA